MSPIFSLRVFPGCGLVGVRFSDRGLGRFPGFVSLRSWRSGLVAFVLGGRVPLRVWKIGDTIPISVPRVRDRVMSPIFLGRLRLFFRARLVFLRV
jgi:hypothetical protein